MIIDGKKIAEEIIKELERAGKIKKELHAIVVGEDPATKSFLKKKEELAHRLGVVFVLHAFREDVREEELREKIHTLAVNPLCGGIVLQLPLPAHLNAQNLLNLIPPEMDVDVLSEYSFGASNVGRERVSSPAVGTFLSVFDRVCVRADGRDASNEERLAVHKKIAVVGLGMLIGKPISAWLLENGFEVYRFGRGSDLAELKNMDVVVIGVGNAGLISSLMIGAHALVVDFGCGMKNGHIVGDFDATGAPETLMYTPTPGGTGPILLAQLFKNFYALNK